MASYASGTDLIARKSAETIGDCASDSGTAISEASIPTNPKVVAVLEGASGQVEAACLAGNRYTVAMLATLSGNSLAYLKDIVCDIAMAKLYYRKASAYAEDYKQALEVADIHLERLRKGERVFDVEDVKDAGTPSYVAPTVAEINGLNLLRDRTFNFYPKRVANV